MQKILSNLDRYLKFYFLTSIILLSLAFVYLFLKINKLSLFMETAGSKEAVSIVFPSQETKEATTSAFVCNEGCQREIKALIASAVASFSAISNNQAPKVISQSTNQGKVSYIPISGPITTTSTSWVDAAGTDIYIDLVNDYGRSAYLTWDGFLKVTNANGTAYARLFDVTHGIAVDGSEISIVDKDVSTQVSSGKLNLWAGRNLYRVQLKSLNSFEVTFVSGRIKITY